MVSSREKKCTTVIPETVFYFADTGPTAPLHGIFVLQQVKTGTLMSFFSGKPIKTEQIRDFPKFAVADGRITRRKMHHVHAEEAFRTGLQPRNRVEGPFAGYPLPHRMAP